VTTVERRQAVRRRPATDEALATLRLRTGHVLIVSNIGDLGCLLSGSARLQPGARIELQLLASGQRLPIPGTVLRCSVTRLEADAIWFESAVRFDALLDTRVGYPVPAPDSVARGAQGTSYPPASGPMAHRDGKVSAG
jgi:hypothetical protein